jgi:hypothetical protein
MRTIGTKKALPVEKNGRSDIAQDQDPGSGSERGHRAHGYFIVEATLS